MAFSRAVLAHKLRASLLSLVVFAVFAVGLSFLAWHYWYPDYLFWQDGGLEGLRIVLAVDFVLGPVLALVFFHPEKSRGKLVFDIVVVALVQLLAMGWGGWQVWSQRPVAVVYGNHRFISVAPDIMRLQKVAPESLARFSPHHPPRVFRRDPRTLPEKQRMLGIMMQYGLHPESQAWLFEPWAPNLDKVFEHQAVIRDMVRKEHAAEWRKWVSGRSNGRLEDYRFALFEGRYRQALLVFLPDGSHAGWIDLGEGPLPDLASPDATAVSR